MKPKGITLLLLAGLGLALAMGGCATKTTQERPQAVVVEDFGPKVEPEPAPEPAPAEDEQSAYQAALAEMGESIHFDFDKSDIRMNQDADRMQKKAELMQRFKDMKLIVEGNCDERGTNEYNMALGSRRANAAKAYLVYMGVDGSRIETVSYGEERPVDFGHDEAAWAKNRRDDFVAR